MDLITENKKLASELGWKPSDFGADGFNSTLIENIKLYQCERFLEVNGIACSRTYRALQMAHEVMADSSHRRQRDANLSELGSISRYPMTDERVIRSRTFAGVSVVRLDPDQRVDGYLEREDGSNIGLFYLTSWTGEQIVDAARDLNLDGLAIVIDEHAWKVVTEANENFLSEYFSELFRFTKPKAVVAALRPNGMTNESKRLWRQLAVFDVACPLVPGPYDGSPIEYAVGQTMATWSIFGGIRPPFCFPIYDPYSLRLRGTEVTDNEIHRFRQWLNDRGIRGMGLWAEGQDNTFENAFTERLPNAVHKIDYH